MSVEDSENDFKSYYETLIAYNGGLPIDQEICENHTRQIEVRANAPTNAERTRAKLESTEEFMGCLFINSSNQNRYSGLKKDLHDNFLMGRDTYPITLQESLHGFIMVTRLITK
mmetsp:Transcript_18060/g.28245  ORF Transcript_18060/g.28245 Transcript_18060/m.28245 type:complete len:114 (+) Transcript_18060:74-415(+)